MLLPTAPTLFSVNSHPAANAFPVPSISTATTLHAAATRATFRV